jgi:ectoine hydroxylase-related dioxygenase (phytanoyl-CoA dioxygenase family)
LNEHWVEADVGDLVIFDKNLAHTSNANTSEKYSAAIVARVWDPTDDLTLSGNVDATPYGGNLGRQNLIVNSDF